METLTSMPTRFAAGTTVEYTVTRSDYPADGGWTMQVTLNGPSKLQVNGAANGASFDVTLTEAQTAALTAGNYQWAEQYTDGTRKFRIVGTVLITPDTVAAAAGALESHAEKVLAVLDAAIEGRLASDMESYQIEGRAVSKIPMVELRRMRAEYASQVWRERNPGKLGPQMVHRFVRAGN